jgi:hypothetical protein
VSSKRNAEARDDWQTPQVVLDRVAKIDRIGLDPASCPGNPTGARVHLTPNRNGLTRNWTNSGLVFVNPPYRMEWYRKILKEALCDAEMIALLMAKPGARYFQDLASVATAVCFWRGRLTFKGAPAPAAFDSALLYFGPRHESFAAAFSDVGWLV